MGGRGAIIAGFYTLLTDLAQEKRPQSVSLCGVSNNYSIWSWIGLSAGAGAAAASSRAAKAALVFDVKNFRINIFRLSIYL